VDARIAAIVADNAGPKAHEPARLARAKGKASGEVDSSVVAAGS
jgi:hypothetical protein